jgi:flagellar secretion chaperone FliS
VNPYNSYAQTTLMGDQDDKGKLLLKVFRVLPQRIDEVKQLISHKKYDKKYEELSKIVSVLEILDASLDRSFGEIPRNLSQLYAYLIRRLREVHNTLNLNTLDECKQILNEIGEGFRGAYEAEKKTSVPPVAKEKTSLGTVAV